MRKKGYDNRAQMSPVELNNARRTLGRIVSSGDFSYIYQLLK